MRTQNRSRVAVSFLYADTDFFFSLLFFCSLLLFCFFGPKSQISSFSERQIQFLIHWFFSFFCPQKLLCGCSLSCADKPLLDVRYYFLHFARFKPPKACPCG